MNGKGSRPRPTNLKRYGQNYQSINWGTQKCSVAFCHRPAEHGKKQCSLHNTLDRLSK